MESDIYLNQREHDHFIKKIHTFFVSGVSHTELGVQWVAERGQYQIIDKKKWMLTKIKYGI
jgi:hypothetical protein